MTPAPTCTRCGQKLDLRWTWKGVRSFHPIRCRRYRRIAAVVRAELQRAT